MTAPSFSRAGANRTSSTALAAIPARYALERITADSADQRAGRAYGSVNIPLRNLDLRDLLQSRFHRPAGLENDAKSEVFAPISGEAKAHGLVKAIAGLASLRSVRELRPSLQA